MARIMLLVKGDETEAREAAERHGLAVADVRVTTGRLATALYCDGEADVLLSRATWWMVEHHDVPFPVGTLLWHSGREVES